MKLNPVVAGAVPAVTAAAVVATATEADRSRATHLEAIAGAVTFVAGTGVAFAGVPSAIEHVRWNNRVSVGIGLMVGSFAGSALPALARELEQL